jgi:branched-chain amino acid transport system ATP-binding protein
MSGLVVKDLSVSHGAVHAVRNLSFTVAPGSLTAIIGANGAGKTSLLRALTGLKKAESGNAFWNDLSLLGAKPEELVRAGVVHVADGKSVIPEFTVEENLDLGGLWRKDKRDVALAKEEILRLFPALSTRLGQHAATLSGGERQMVAIGRALMSRPELLLLDEPSLGLAPKVIAGIFTSLNQLRVEFGLTIALVEQNAMSALKVADQGVVINLGQLVASGPAPQLLADPALRAAYLGF